MFSSLFVSICGNALKWHVYEPGESSKCGMYCVGLVASYRMVKGNAQGATILDVCYCGDYVGNGIRLCC